MSFLLHQLGQLAMVFIVMVCALLGTVGIIKLIKKFFPFIDLPQNLFHTGKNEEHNHKNTEDK